MKRGTDRKLKFLLLKQRLRLPVYQVKGILQAIWDFTFDNAPRGDVGRFTDEQICAAIEYKGDAAKLIYALQIEHWLEPHPIHRFVIHGWKKHAEPFLIQSLKRTGFAEDDQSIIQDEIPPNLSGPEIPIPSPEMLLALWSADRLQDWPKCLNMRDSRRAHAKARLKEIPDLDRWRSVIAFLKRDRWWERAGQPWRPNIDWLLRPGKVMEYLEKLERYEPAKKIEPVPQAPIACSKCGIVEDLEKEIFVFITKFGPRKGIPFCEKCLDADKTDVEDAS